MLHPRFLFLLPYLFVLLATVVNSAPVPRTTDCPSCSGLPRTLQSRGFWSSLFGCFKGAEDVQHTGAAVDGTRQALRQSLAAMQELRANPELSQLEQVELKNVATAANTYQEQLLQHDPVTSDLYKAAMSTSGL